MRMPSRLILVSACALLLSSGCSQSLLRMTAAKPEPAVATQLVETLSEDRWTFNSEWSPTSTQHAWRWRFRLDPQILRSLPTDSTVLPTGLTKTEDLDDTRPVVDSIRDFSEDEHNLPTAWITQLPHLAERSDQVGRNAAIMLAQHQPASGSALADRLQACVAGTDTVPPITNWWSLSADQAADPVMTSDACRAAAAEAWCRVLGDQPGEAIDNFAPIARFLQSHEDLPVGVRLELWRGVSRHVPPVAIAEINAGLLSEANGRPVRQEVRQAALEACVIYAISHPNESEWSSAVWPENLLEWADHGVHTVEDDPIMRKQFGTWLALTQHPGAVEFLKAQLTDSETTNRQHAMLNLGRLQTPAALEVLQQQARRTEPSIRAAAVRALSRWGVRAIAEFADDSSSEVRMAVAESLGNYPDLQAANMLWRLQTDPSRDVQRAVLAAVRGWPDSLAIPILLHSLERGTTTTRRRAYSELATRTGMAEPFPFFGTAAERADAVHSLARRHDLPVRLDGPSTTTAQTPSVAQHIDDLQADLKLVTAVDINPRSAEYQDAFERLQHAKPADVPAIEAFLAASDPTSPGIIRLEQDVLPAISPVYAALAKFPAGDLQTRRQLSREFATFGAEQSLSPLVIRRLGEYLTKETDELIWRSILQAVWQDSHPDIDRIIRLAAHQEVTGVRQLACEYAAAHPRPEHGEWLPLLLNDENLAVQLAAIDAAGRCRNRRVLDGVQHPNSEESSGLRPLLTSSQELVRIAAAIAMSRHGDPQGLDELTRLSWHADGRVRRKVVLAMGESGQARFIEHLIRLGWTDRDVTVRRAVLESLDRLVPPETRPAELAKIRTTDQRMTAWQNWRFASSSESARMGEAIPIQQGKRPDERNP